ncbi:MAG TPA: PQQ-dependent sugar dehydrogenase [Pyrinomonadaceae bacterium]|nr:PQQ-dependent sugar dehydrogenase [Pyrinomonadaceae bacterium]
MNRQVTQTVPLMAALIVCVLVFIADAQLVPQKILLKNGRSVSLDLPPGFEIIPAAEGFKRVRFFANAPDGRIFVTDLYNLTDNKRGAIYILDSFDEKTGKFAVVKTYMSGLHNPNSVQFFRDASGQDWIYIAETGKLTRRKFKRGEETPTDLQPQTVATFPDYGLSYKYGGWHLTRTIAFGTNGKLYVSVGSSCNSCVEKEEVRATILEMNPDGTGQRVFAKGLRNAVGLRWIGNFLFATNQGSDHLGLQRPDETFYAVKAGADHGWPYCHTASGRIIADPKIKRAGGCRNVPTPYAVFPARSSALGFDYFDDADVPAQFKDGFVVALHGSTNKAIGRGYKIVVMRKGEPLRDLVTGFLRAGRVAGRPCDILKTGPASFLFTDDHSGIVYLFRKRKG